MDLVKVKKEFFIKCKMNGAYKELLISDSGRPCVLLINLKYKGRFLKFVVPIRSNISPNTPKNTFFALPPNSRTKQRHYHGIHYTKMFPIKDEFIDQFLISSNMFLVNIKKIIDANEKDIVCSCQKYLNNYEHGLKVLYSPDIDKILEWLNI